GARLRGPAEKSLSDRHGSRAFALALLSSTARFPDMWRRKRRNAETDKPVEPPPRLKDALRKARLDQAERTGTVIDLRDAELARLELLNAALDPVFAEIPSEVDVFDRGISLGETPRLWIDAVAHVAVGRDKRIYRFLQDTRY